MILNKLVFVIRPSGSGKLEFVEPFTRDFKLTANSINRDIFYVVAPFAADTYVKATFKSKEQAEKGENVSLRLSELEPKDIINDNLGGFNLIEDWFVWEGKVPSKALGYVSAHRGNEIGLSISFEEKTVPRVPVGVELKGEIVKLDDLDGEGAYVIKVPALEYDTEEYAFYKDLLILDNEEEITIKKSIIRRLGTITEHYYVDPNVYDEGWEQIPDEDYEFIPDLIMATGDNKSDIKLIYLSLESLDDKVLVLEQHAIDTDIELNRLQTNKQDKLVAGNNISIVGNTISANSNEPDGVTIVLNEDDKLEVNLKHIMNGGYL